MTRIRTRGELDDLIEAIKSGNAHFIGYEPPLAMIAVENQMNEAPIGHLIPALMQALAHCQAANPCPFCGGPDDHRGIVGDPPGRQWTACLGKYGEYVDEGQP